MIVELTQGEYDALNKDQEKLRALEAAGVDNWEGYGHAMAILHGEED